MYGSILRDVTAIPQQFNNVPKELAITPFPTPEITPPVTKMYFMLCSSRFFTCCISFDLFFINESTEIRRENKLNNVVPLKL